MTEAEAYETEFASGTAVSGCIIESILGRGGMGVVYLARQYALDRMVALKIIDPVVAADQEMRERFMREARAFAAIEHPNVLPIYDIGQEGGRLFLIMRYVDTGDLETFMAIRPLELPTVVEIVEQIASALDAAHAEGLIHRDVKPQNVLVDTTADDAHVYLTDFGLVRRVGDAALTLPGTVLGTPLYMAPEQALGQSIDFRVDVYALGCILFQLLTGNVPYAASEVTAVLVAHQLSDIPSVLDRRPELPGPIDAVVKRALAKDRGDRFLSAGDLAAAARTALTGIAGAAPESSVATGDAAPKQAFPEPTPDFIHTQCPRMAVAQFDSFLNFLEGRGWSRRDIRELVHPWAPREWKQIKNASS